MFSRRWKREQCKLIIQVALCLVVRAHRGVYILVKHSLFVSITKTGARRIIRPDELSSVGRLERRMFLHKRGITRRTKNVFPSSSSNFRS